jgi:hypothetical protein
MATGLLQTLQSTLFSANRRGDGKTVVFHGAKYDDAAEKKDSAKCCEFSRTTASPVEARKRRSAKANEKLFYNTRFNRANKSVEPGSEKEKLLLMSPQELGGRNKSNLPTQSIEWISFIVGNAFS